MLSLLLESLTVLEVAAVVVAAALSAAPATAGSDVIAACARELHGAAAVAAADEQALCQSGRGGLRGLGVAVQCGAV